MNEQQEPDVPGLDNLTPFEYALAGVTIPEGHEDSPSLAVIRDMRHMASDVQDAPVKHAGLREFLQTGGSIAKRSDRRTARDRKPTQPKTAKPAGRDVSPGSFIDITPVELVDGGVQTQDTPAEQVTSRAVVNDFEDTVPPVPADELKALGLAAGHSDEPTPARPGADGSSLDDPTMPILGADPAPQEPEAVSVPAEPNPESAQQGGATEPLNRPVDKDPDDAESFTLTRIEPPKQTESPLHLDDGTELPPRQPSEAASRNSDFSSDLFPDVEDDPNLKVAGAHPDRPADRATGSEAAALAAASPLFADSDPDGEPIDDGTGLLSKADDASAGILGSTDHEDAFDDQNYDQNYDKESMTPAYAGSVPIQKRRLSFGALLALGGTMVVSAALAVGALWWADGRGGEGTETEAAAPESTTTVPEAEVGSDAEAEVEEEGSPSTLDISQSGTTLGGSNGDTPVDPDPTGDSEGSDSDDQSETSPSTDGSSTDGSSTDTTEAATEPEATDTPDTTTPPEPEPQETTAPTDLEPQPTTPEEPSTEVTTSAGAGAPAYIGDSVNVGSYSGPPVQGALVGLFEDTDRDGEPDGRIDTRFTGRDGRYAFNVPAACYVVRFYPIDGYRVDENLEFQSVCLDPGEAAPRIDGILHPTVQDVAPAAPPSGCFVEPASYGSVAGVEVYENGRDWADSYIFYSLNGGVVARTSELGPPDDIDGPTDWEWEAEESGFPHRSVRRVSAVRNGSESEPITCSR